MAERVLADMLVRRGQQLTVERRLARRLQADQDRDFGHRRYCVNQSSACLAQSAGTECAPGNSSYRT